MDIEPDDAEYALIGALVAHLFKWEELRGETLLARVKKIYFKALESEDLTVPETFYPDFVDLVKGIEQGVNANSLEELLSKYESH